MYTHLHVLFVLNFVKTEKFIFLQKLCEYRVLCWTVAYLELWRYLGTYTPSQWDGNTAVHFELF